MLARSTAQAIDAIFGAIKDVCERAARERFPVVTRERYDRVREALMACEDGDRLRLALARSYFEVPIGEEDVDVVEEAIDRDWKRSRSVALAVLANLLLEGNAGGRRIETVSR